MTSDLTLLHLLWYFLIYGFLGWCAEVAYHAVTCGQVINRGFLNGPICPIYGVGMVGVLCLLHPFVRGGSHESLGLLFLAGALLATLVELIGGWVLDRIYHTRWWDYSNKPFHFHGYICLQFSLLWGFAIVLAAEEIHPIVRRMIVAPLPHMLSVVLLAILYAGFVTDLILTVVMLNQMSRHLAELEEIQTAMRSVSDKLTDVIANTTISAAQKVGEGQVQAALGKAELKETVNERYESYQREMERKRDELQGKAEQLYAILLRYRFAGRIVDAFPSLHSWDHAELMETLKTRWASRSNRH